MSEGMSAVPAAPVVDPSPVVASSTPGFVAVPGAVCPTCHRSVPKPSRIGRAVKKVFRAGRVVLHDPVVDRQGKALVGVIAMRFLAAAGASNGLVMLVRTALHAAGVSV